MKWSILQSVLYGFITGFAELLPVSADSHSLLFLNLTGGQEGYPIFRFAAHLGIIAALLFSCRSQIFRLRREFKISRVPPKRRRRQPDSEALMDIRLLKTAIVPCAVSFVFYLFAQNAGSTLWLLSILLLVNGIILYLPQFFSSGNRTSQSMSALDGILIGSSAALAIFPGISRMGLISSVAQMRGTDRQYAVNIGLLLTAPILSVVLVFDIYYLFALSATFIFAQFFHYLLTLAAAFAGTYLSVIFVRFLAVKTGFVGAAFYSWGLALFTIILYLLV